MNCNRNYASVIRRQLLYVFIFHPMGFEGLATMLVSVNIFSKLVLQSLTSRDVSALESSFRILDWTCCYRLSDLCSYIEYFTGEFQASQLIVAGEFPTQRPVTRSFDVFFDLRLNKRLNKQSWGWWFETPSCRSWRHSNADPRWAIGRGWLQAPASDGPPCDPQGWDVVFNQRSSLSITRTNIHSTSYFVKCWHHLPDCHVNLAREQKFTMIMDLFEVKFSNSKSI